MAREDFYRLLFYEVLDKFLAESKDRFIDHRESIGIGDYNPGSVIFLCHLEIN